MGLDNGIYVVLKNNIPQNRAISKFQHRFPGDDICYWRNCWNIRDDIIKTLYLDSTNDCLFCLDDFDLAAVQTILTSYNYKNWEPHRARGKTWKEMKPILRRQRRDLKWFLKWYCKNSEYIEKIVFYDSY